MKYRIYIIIALLCLTTAANAQTIKELFTTLPDTILPSLSKNDRLDMVDLIENNMENEVTNRLRGKSRLTMLTDNLAKIQLSELAEVQLCKLPTPDSYLICVIHSVKTDAWDSTTKFYHPDWTPSTYKLSTHSSGNILMTFSYYNFTDDTTLATTVSDLRNNDGKIVWKDGGTVKIKWNKEQQRFLKDESMP
jgi:hypothetical protein